MKGTEKQVKYATDLIEQVVKPLIGEIKADEEFQALDAEGQEIILKSVEAIINGLSAANAWDTIEILKKGSSFIAYLPDDTALDKWEHLAGCIEIGMEDHGWNSAIKIIRNDPDFRAIYDEA